MKSKVAQLSLLLVFISTSLVAQRIIGYFPNYAYNPATYNLVQYSKLTHLYYFTLNPDETSPGSATSNGNLWIDDTWSWFTMARFNNVKNYVNTLSPKPRIIIVTGGAPGGDYNLNNRFLDIGSNAGKLNKFTNALVGFINANGLDGWDLDWEFPNTTAEKNAQQAMVQRMRFKLDSLGLINCKKYEVSIAVGGNYTDVPLPAAKICWNPANTDQMNQATINTVDFFNLMTYDGSIGSAPCSFSSHQHYNLVTKAYTEWNAGYTIPASKINIGVGFYNNAGTAFNVGGNNSTWYNNATYWPTGGSGCPNMQAKINYARGNGNSGVFIWHLLQDNLCSGTTPACYSLLDCIYQHTTTTWGTPAAYSNPCGLPVDFLQFTAKRNKDKVILNWTAASEQGSAYYSVERSLNGFQFQEIAKVPTGSSSNGIGSYEVIDENSISEVVYYRIAQYDESGEKHYSDVVDVANTDLDFGVLFSANPFSDFLTVKTYCEFSNDKVNLQLLDANGKIVETSLVSLNSSIDMGREIPSGFYWIQLNYNGEVKRFKVIKQ